MIILKSSTIKSGMVMQRDIERLVVSLDELPFWKDLISFLLSRGQRAYLLGGILRDLLLGRSSRDLDIAVAEDPLAFTRDFAKTIGAKLVTLDSRYGLMRVMKKGEMQLDCSSLRGGLIQEDLARRDFSINAMAIEIPPHSEPWRPILIDPFDGIKDLESRMIRIVPPNPFPEDPLRILRAFRHFAELGFELNPETMTTMKSNIHLLHKVSPERIRDEWMKILDSKRAGETVGIMDSCGLIEQFLPEVGSMKGVSQNEHHHLDVLGHSLVTLNNLEVLMRDLPNLFPSLHRPFEELLFREQFLPGYSSRSLLKFAALLHDAGKPSTRSIDNKGRIRFFNHERDGDEIAREICLRLRFSVRETRIIQRWIRNHMRPGQLFCVKNPSKQVIVRFFRQNIEDYPALFLLFLADILSTSGPAAARDAFQKALYFVCEMLAIYEKEIRCRLERERLINGHDLKERLELEPGPIFSTILMDVELHQAEGLLTSREEALQWVRARYDL